MNAVKTILFVENDPVALTMYQNRLQREGFHVETAHDGLLALKFLSQHTPDVVVLDLMLPRFSGAEVFKFMRKDSRLSNVPVVIFSNAAMTDWPQDLGVGTTQCLPKTESTFPQLLQTIRDLMFNAPVRPVAAPKAAPKGPPTFAVESSPPPPPVQEPVPAVAAAAAITTVLKGRPEFVKDTLAEIPRLHEFCLAYIKAPASDSSRPHLVTLHQRVHSLCTEANRVGCTRVFMLTNAYGALLSEIMSKPSWATPSILQTMAQGVDCLRFLLKSDDVGLAEPSPRAKVLAVDDDPVCNHVMVTTLRRANFDVTNLESPTAALQLLQKNRYDLVLLDVNMPDLTGFEVCVKLRQIPHCKTIPVIFVTAFNNFENRKQSVLSGGDDFITKPISPLELALKVTIHMLKAQVKHGSVPQSDLEPDTGEIASRLPPPPVQISPLALNPAALPSPMVPATDPGLSAQFSQAAAEPATPAQTGQHQAESVEAQPFNPFAPDAQRGDAAIANTYEAPSTEPSPDLPEGAAQPADSDSAWQQAGSESSDPTPPGVLEPMTESQTSDAAEAAAATSFDSVPPTEEAMPAYVSEDAEDTVQPEVQDPAFRAEDDEDDEEHHAMSSNPPSEVTDAHLSEPAEAESAYPPASPSPEPSPAYEPSGSFEGAYPAPVYHYEDSERSVVFVPANETREDTVDAAVDAAVARAFDPASSSAEPSPAMASQEAYQPAARSQQFQDHESHSPAPPSLSEAVTETRTESVPETAEASPFTSAAPQAEPTPAYASESMGQLDVPDQFFKRKSSEPSARATPERFSPPTEPHTDDVSRVPEAPATSFSTARPADESARVSQAPVQPSAPDRTWLREDAEAAPSIPFGRSTPLDEPSSVPQAPAQPSAPANTWMSEEAEEAKPLSSSPFGRSTPLDEPSSVPQAPAQPSAPANTWMSEEAEEAKPLSSSPFGRSTPLDEPSSVPQAPVQPFAPARTWMPEEAEATKPPASIPFGRATPADEPAAVAQAAVQPPAPTRQHQDAEAVKPLPPIAFTSEASSPAKDSEEVAERPIINPFAAVRPADEKPLDTEDSSQSADLGKSLLHQNKETALSDQSEPAAEELRKVEEPKKAEQTAQPAPVNPFEVVRPAAEPSPAFASYGTSQPAPALTWSYQNSEGYAIPSNLFVPTTESQARGAVSTNSFVAAPAAVSENALQPASPSRTSWPTGAGNDGSLPPGLLPPATESRTGDAASDDPFKATPPEPSSISDTESTAQPAVPPQSRLHENVEEGSSTSSSVPASAFESHVDKAEISRPTEPVSVESSVANTPQPAASAQTSSAESDQVQSSAEQTGEISERPAHDLIAPDVQSETATAATVNRFEAATESSPTSIPEPEVTPQSTKPAQTELAGSFEAAPSVTESEPAHVSESTLQPAASTESHQSAASESHLEESLASSPLPSADESRTKDEPAAIANPFEVKPPASEPVLASETASESSAPAPFNQRTGDDFSGEESLIPFSLLSYVEELSANPAAESSIANPFEAAPPATESSQVAASESAFQPDASTESHQPARAESNRDSALPSSLVTPATESHGSESRMVPAASAPETGLTSTGEAGAVELSENAAQPAAPTPGSAPAIIMPAPAFGAWSNQSGASVDSAASTPAGKDQPVAPQNPTGANAPAANPQSTFGDPISSKKTFDRIAAELARIIFAGEPLTDVKIRLVRIALERYTVQQILDGSAGG